MIALIQRVLEASVHIDGEQTASIHGGLLALIGVRPADTEAHSRRLIERVLQYRVFDDGEGRMNRSLTVVQGGLLLVPQFTLAADTHKGTRPGFSTAAPPDLARRLFDLAVEEARSRHREVACGVFGADMQVSLINDGPVTIWLES
ncbi:MAG: D-aminoacyl-tRNA deacylase [Steroidobacteraceae bacterium]